jgi:hypothetical protein
LALIDKLKPCIPDRPETSNSEEFRTSQPDFITLLVIKSKKKLIVLIVKKVTTTKNVIEYATAGGGGRGGGGRNIPTKLGNIVQIPKCLKNV